MPNFSELPVEIKNMFFSFMMDKMQIDEFENWVYQSHELEEVLDEANYLSLISFEYKQKGARLELVELLSGFVDAGEYETARIRNLLTEALRKNERFPGILMELYDLYCKGYDFLQVLGIDYGLKVKVPQETGYWGNWSDLTAKQQLKLLEGFSPVDGELKKVISWIDDKKILLTGRKRRDNDYYYEYVDLRFE
jgi:hypothetical protein